MRTMIVVNNTLFFWLVITGLFSATSLSPACALDEGPFGFLSRFHPKVSTSMIVTRPEHVERVLQHSLVFNPNQARSVLPEMNKVLTRRRGWRKIEAMSGEYVVYKRRGATVTYMSAHVYQHLNWPKGAKPLPTKRAGCVVEYFTLKK